MFGSKDCLMSIPYVLNSEIVSKEFLAQLHTSYTSFIKNAIHMLLNVRREQSMFFPKLCFECLTKLGQCRPTFTWIGE